MFQKKMTHKQVIATTKKKNSMTEKEKPASINTEPTADETADLLECKTKNIMKTFAVIVCICLIGAGYTAKKEAEKRSFTSKDNAAQTIQEQILEEQSFEVTVYDKKCESNNLYSIFLELKGSNNLMCFSADADSCSEISKGDTITVIKQRYKASSDSFAKTRWLYQDIELEGVQFDNAI